MKEKEEVILLQKSCYEMQPVRNKRINLLSAHIEKLKFVAIKLEIVALIQDILHKSAAHIHNIYTREMDGNFFTLV